MIKNLVWPRRLTSNKRLSLGALKGHDNKLTLTSGGNNKRLDWGLQQDNHKKSGFFHLENF